MASNLIIKAIFFSIFIATAAATRGRKCEQQQELRSCEGYLKYSTCETVHEATDWREEFKKCCNELEEMEEECRCNGVKQVFERLKSGGYKLSVMEMHDIFLTAQTLPSLCRMGPSECHNLGPNRTSF